MIWLSLLRRFWWLIPVTALCVTASVYRIQRDHARRDLAEANSVIVRIKGVIQRNTEVSAHDKAVADAKLESSQHATDLLAADLERRVRDYENRISASAVQATGEPIQAVGGGTPAQDPIPDLIARTISACARDAARLDNAYEWATAVAHEQPAGPNP